MSDSQVHSRSKWHYESEKYPEGLPPENAHAHSGFYLVWLLDKNLVSESFLADHQKTIEKVRARKIAPGTFFGLIGETLDDQMLTDLGSQFTEEYFGEMYVDDYWLAFEDDYQSFFNVDDNFQNYEIVADFLSEMFQSWQEDNSV